ncbi:MAG: nucleoside deaminase [Oscillibacter sp.]|nr:nucleoside deaminase [Oscillibacter sp.]
MANPYMKLAIEEAESGIHAGHGGPFGCVIVKDGVVVGRGHNEVLKRNDPTCHGEMMAIREACRTVGTYDLSGCELYTTAAPCPMCFGAILWANIRKVYYGCSVSDTDKIGFRDEEFYNAKHDFSEELDRPECLKLFQEYNALRDKTLY